MIGAPSFTQVVSAVTAQTPLAVFVGGPSGPGHFVVVYGYQVDPSGTEYVHVADPDSVFGGSRMILHSALCVSYLHHGGVQEYYLTRR